VKRDWEGGKEGRRGLIKNMEETEGERKEEEVKNG